MIDDDDDLQSWTAKHPDHWSTKEVLDWVFDVVQRHNLDASMIPGENFQNVSGLQLCRMSREEFIARDPTFGSYLFDVLQELLKGVTATFTSSECDLSTTTNNFGFTSTHSMIEDTFSDASASNCFQEDGINVRIGEDVYDIDVKPIDLPGIEGIGEPFNSGYYSESGSACSTDSDCQSVFTDTPETQTFTDDTYSQYHILPKSPYHTDSLYSFSSDTGEEIDLVVKSRRKMENKRKAGIGKRKYVSKGGHLWEFIRDALKDPDCNPTLLKWEDKEEGVFRFVKSEAVARLWGRKKNNPGMTYEKLSRAMRFCRTTGCFTRLPKTGKYPKKLCFKFGAKTFGWQE